MERRPALTGAGANGSPSVQSCPVATCNIVLVPTPGVGAFPARAGMNRGVTSPGTRVLRVPRTCGDEPDPATDAYEALERSPHVRG